MHILSIFVLMTVLTTATYSDVPEYTVSTPQEFWNAIGPDRTVIVEGTIVLSDLIPDAETTGDYEASITWLEAGLNPSVSISGVENLTIRGASASGCTLLTEEAYSWVLMVFDCNRFRLENLVVGHIPAGACMDGVLLMGGCSDVTIDGCELFGCGTVGLELSDVWDFTMRSSIITDCGHGILRLDNSCNLRFLESEFRDNDCLFGVRIDGRYGCDDVEFRNCLFADNVISRFEPGFFYSNGSEILLEGCVVTGNTYPLLNNPICYLTLVDTEIEDNTIID